MAYKGSNSSIGERQNQKSHPLPEMSSLALKNPLTRVFAFLEAKP